MFLLQSSVPPSFQSTATVPLPNQNNITCWSLCSLLLLAGLEIREVSPSYPFNRWCKSLRKQLLFVLYDSPRDYKGQIYHTSALWLKPMHLHCKFICAGSGTDTVGSVNNKPAGCSGINWSNCIRLLWMNFCQSLSTQKFHNEWNRKTLKFPLSTSRTTIMSKLCFFNFQPWRQSANNLKTIETTIENISGWVSRKNN